MSAASAARATRTARTAPAARPTRPPLRLVPAPRFRPPRAPFVVLVVGLLGVGLLGLLLLNTVIAQNAFRLHTLQVQNAALELKKQELAKQVDTYEAPEVLASRAAKLGMVPAGNPAFIVLPEGKVVGSPEPAEKRVPIRIKGVSPNTGQPTR